VPHTVVFLWISAATLTPGPSPDLADYGARRGLSFVPLDRTRPAILPSYDATLVDELEAELDQARTALSALEEGPADVRLGRVEQALLAHPHLPQAAPLMAECLALQGRAASVRAPLRSAWLAARRFALEGPRAEAFGEAAVPLPPSEARSVELSGPDPSDELEFDGAIVAADEGRVPLLAGLHHVRVSRHGRPIFAAFVELPPDARRLALAVPPLVPCSADDLDPVLRDPNDTARVRCSHWAKVRPEPAGVGIALCEGERCGKFVHWQHRPAPPFSPAPNERAILPAWASFAIAGGAALLASGLVLWQSGAFERGHPSATTWQYGGVSPQAVRF